jgi:hypothetical protein
MQKFIAWWCELIGVTDPEAIRVATGVAAIAVGALIILWIFNTIAGVMMPKHGSLFAGGLFAPIRARRPRLRRHRGNCGRTACHHKSMDTLWGYVRDAEIFKNHAAEGLL